MTYRYGYCLLLTTLLCLPLLLAACSDDGTSPRIPAPVTGQVLDSAGQPVADAGILLNYQLPVFPAKAAEDRPATGFSFDLPDTAWVKVFILAPCQGDTIRVLADQQMGPGHMFLIWDGHDEAGLIVPSSTYDFHLMTDGQDTVTSFLLLLDDYPLDADPTLYRFLTLTDADGNFSLDQECLALGFQQPMIGIEGDTTGVFSLSREVRLFAMKAGHPTAMGDWVTVNDQDGAQVVLQFAR